MLDFAIIFMRQHTFKPFFILLCFTLSLPSLARQSCDWPFRTQIEVQENSISGSQLTNYQVKFEISATDLSSDYSWSDNGQDLYIYDNDDQTELEFWIDSWNSVAETAVIWVRFPTLEIAQVRTLYFYYGNENAPAAGDVPFTFTDPGIKFHTRSSSSNPNNLTQALSAFNASNDQDVRYGCGFITNFTGITNRSQFGNGNSNFAAFSESYFLVNSGETGRWQFRYGADFGNGGGLYVDGIALEEQWRDNLWWANRWNRANEVLQGSINLTEGYHKLEVLGFEDCCDGGITVQFKKPGGNWTTFSTTSIDIRSRACPLAQEPTYNIVNHDVCRIDLGFDNSLDYPTAWVVNDTRPVSFAIENLSTSHPSLPDTRVAIILGAGLSLSSSLGSNWICSTVSNNPSATELDCQYSLAINPNGASSNLLTLNIASSSANNNANFSATVFSKQFENQLINNQTSTNLPVWQLAEDIIPTCSVPNPGVFTRIYNSQGYGDNYANSAAEFDAWESDLAIRANLDGQTVLNQINNNSGNPFEFRGNEYYLTLIEGYLYAPEDGFYNFAVDGDDAVELKINDIVFSSWYDGHGAQNSPHDENTWGLSKGYHKLNYRMQEYLGGDSFYAYWRKPADSSTIIIPPTAFFHCAGDADIRLNMTVKMQDNPDTPGTNDKAIPGAVLLYSLVAKNEGNISVKSSNMELIQTLSNNTKLYVNNLFPSGPIDFKDGSDNDISGLAYTFSNLNNNSDNLSFSDDGANSFDYIPTADSEGYDTNITHFKLTFTGNMNPKFDQGTPKFNISYQIKIR
jgi:Domain of unknown function (DUF2341)/PA14 domain